MEKRELSTTTIMKNANASEHQHGRGKKSGRRLQSTRQEQGIHKQDISSSCAGKKSFAAAPPPPRGTRRLAAVAPLATRSTLVTKAITQVSAESST